MPYIPEKHQKYNILPACRKDGGEVFSYPVNLLNELLACRDLMPYGYQSYEGYDKEIDKWINEFQSNSEEVEKLEACKQRVRKMNQKEVWSICRYIGDDKRLIDGKLYYWPCSIDHPVYGGVIDDEEFTGYTYPTDASRWEIVEDPTGMAFRTIFEGKNSISVEKLDALFEQFNVEQSSSGSNEV